MESAERKDGNLEMVRKALQQLLEERKQSGKNEAEEGDEEEDLLSKLLSQVESSEKNATATEFPIDLAAKQDASSVCSRMEAQKRGTTEEVNKDEVAKELRRIRKQNAITHCLLSVMIVVTAAWQFGEASLLLAVRDKFSHPLRAVGGLIMGAIKGKKSSVLPKIEVPPLLPISVPDMPLLTLNRDDDDE